METIDVAIDNEVEAASADRVDGSKAVSHVCSFQRKSRFNTSEEIASPFAAQDKERFLCVSDGFEIYCLDLKKGESASRDNSYESPDLPPLPKISTLNLLEKGFPVTSGFFKHGTDVFIVGGQDIPAFKSLPYVYLPDGLEVNDNIKGTSRKFCHLFLKDGKLSVEGCANFPLLKKPKFWPIVEMISDEIHVFESLPILSAACLDPREYSSQEVLNLADGSEWRLTHVHCPEDAEQGFFIREHLVLGDRIIIFASACCYKFLIFDMKTNKWKLYEDRCGWPRVGREFPLGNHICIGKSRNSSDSKEGPLYLVLGIGDVVVDSGPSYTYMINSEMTARAYLVTPSAEVRRSQNLPCVFERLSREKRLAVISSASLFKVDEQTVCIVAVGTHDAENSFLCICSVSVEEIEIGDAEEFVKVDVKDFRAYHLGRHNLRVGGTSCHCPPRLSALFL